MEQPLGSTAGNLLEVRESVEALEGGGPGDLREVTLRLAGHMLRLGGLCASVAEGEERAARCLDDGSAREAFARNVRLQGGDLEAALDPARRAAVVQPLRGGARRLCEAPRRLWRRHGGRASRGGPVAAGGGGAARTSGS